MARAVRRKRRRPGLPCLALAAVACLALPARGGSEGAAGALVRADAVWERRAEGCDETGRAQRIRAAEAIDAYEAAASAEPAGLAARWKLVRALYFAADHTTGAPGEAVPLLVRAVRESDAALALLAERLGIASRIDAFTPERLRALAPEEVPDAAGALFWSAVAWGGWSKHHGAIEAVRAGVADRLYHAARAVIALDPSFEDGGAHRLLARVHVVVPRIPFYTGWVDAELAVPAAEQAVALAPAHPANRYLLALTILDVAPERRAEALRLLEEAALAKPRPEQRAEDLAIRAAARERLAREVAAGPRPAGDVAAAPRAGDGVN